jgi:hypothetical protein
MDLYPWIVLLHIVGAFLFALSHGVAVWMAIQLRSERDPRRIGALLDLSGTSLNGLYLGLLLLLVGGIWAGIYRGWFQYAWIWAALVILVAIVILMYVVATPFFKELRTALGQRTMGMPQDAPDPVPLSDGEIAAIAARTPVALLSAIGFGGLLIILWLMVVKPFSGP